MPLVPVTNPARGAALAGHHDAPCSFCSSARRCGDATLACRQLCLHPTSTTSGWADGWAHSFISSLPSVHSCGFGSHSQWGRLCGLVCCCPPQLAWLVSWQCNPPQSKNIGRPPLAPCASQTGGCADPAFRREHLSGHSFSVPLTDVLGWMFGIVTPFSRKTNSVSQSVH